MSDGHDGKGRPAASLRAANARLRREVEAQLEPAEVMRAHSLVGGGRG